MAANPGVVSQFAIGDANPIEGGSVGRLISIQSESIRETTTFFDGNGTVGSRSHYSNRVGKGPRSVGGDFSFYGVVDDAKYLLVKAMGGGTATAPALAEALPSFVIQKKLSGTGNRVMTYPTCYVSTLQLSGRRGEGILFGCNVVGLTQAEGSSFPSITPDSSTGLWMFEELVLTLDSTVYKCSDFSLTIDNAVQTQQVNSRDATAGFATDRIITLSHTIPEADLLYETFQDAEVDATLVFTNGTHVMTFTIPVLRYTNETPSIVPRGENIYPLTGMAFRTSGSAELTCAIATV